MPEIFITVRESLSFAGDPVETNVLTRRRDSITPADFASLHLEAVRREEIGLIETVSSVTEYHRGAADSFGLADSAVVHLSIYRRETLRILDDGIAGPHGVYADLAVYDEGMTEAGLTDLSEYGPVGFGRFRPFRPGMYQFEELVFKTAMKSLTPNSLPRIDEIYVQADVDDRAERGVGVVATAPTGEATITFRTPFYALPEIVAIYKTTTIPCDVEVYAVTEAGFKAKLKRRDTGAYVTGTFTYAALGR